MKWERVVLDCDELWLAQTSRAETSGRVVDCLQEGLRVDVFLNRVFET